MFSLSCLLGLTNPKGGSDGNVWYRSQQHNANNFLKVTLCNFLVYLNLIHRQVKWNYEISVELVCLLVRQTRLSWWLSALESFAFSRKKHCPQNSPNGSRLLETSSQNSSLRMKHVTLSLWFWWYFLWQNVDDIFMFMGYKMKLVVLHLVFHSVINLEVMSTIHIIPRILKPKTFGDHISATLGTPTLFGLMLLLT